MVNQLKEKVTEQVETRLSDQKGRAAETVSTVADTLRTSSQQLSDSGQDGVSRYIERAADQAERLASYLDSTEVTEVVDRVEDFARRQPAAFMAGAFAVGFLASRFLKANRADYGTDYTTRALPSDTAGDYETGANFGFDSPRTSVGLETGSQFGDPNNNTGSNPGGV